MTFKEASMKFNLPMKVLYRFYELGLVSGTTLTDEDIKNIGIILKVYEDPVLLKARLTKFSKARRKDLIRTAGLTKWESYVFNRYRNHILNKSGKRLVVKQVTDEVRHYYGIETSFTVIRRIYQLRKRAYNSLRTGSDG